MTSIEHRPLAASSAIAGWRTPALIIGFGCLISLMSFGPRSSLGFFLTPMSAANHWGRDVFAFALALQNLLWGIGQPIAGIIADRYGAARVFCAGGLMYAAGLALMSQAASAPVLDVSAGPLIGFGLSGTSFMVMLRRSPNCCRRNGAPSPSALAPRPARSASSCFRRSRSC